MALIVAPGVSPDQPSILLKIQKILHIPQHPYATLNELHQIGAIIGLQQDKSGTSTLNTVIITAQIHFNSRKIVSTREAASLKQAKQLASQEVLEEVVRSFEHHVPSSLSLPLRTKPLTVAEQRVKAGDMEHVDQLQDVFDAAVDKMLGHEVEEKGIISIDLEMWEKDHSINLEIGISFVEATKVFDRTRFTTYHYINSTHAHHRNTLKDLDQQDNFRFGTSVWVSDPEILAEVETRVQELTARFPDVYIVGHSIGANITWLRRMGFTFMDGMIPIDIGRIYRRFISPMPYNLVSMAKMLRGLGLSDKNVHNAGNDARYGLDALSALAVAFVCNSADEFINVNAH